jgi:methylenetetrahydrofolate reductase (NADPH)
VKVLKKQKGLVNRILTSRPYQPDDLLAGLQTHLGAPDLNIPGFHLFSFNDVERTERWRQQTLQKLNGGLQQ